MKYLFVYKSAQPFNIAALPEAQVIQMMKAWGEWVGSMGSAVVDGGTAFSAGGKRVAGGGVSDADLHAAGYSIVDAPDFDGALRLAQTSPIVARGGSVEVYEAFGYEA
jgi:hypothetical protein